MQSSHEYEFNCPYCGDGISFLLETFGEHTVQIYIEDCETCCRPIQVNYRSDGFEIVTFAVQTTDE